MTDPTSLAKLAWLSILLPGHEMVRQRAGVELAAGADLATLLDNYQRLGGDVQDRAALLSAAESAVLNAGLHGDQERAEELAQAIIAEAKRVLL